MGIVAAAGAVAVTSLAGCSSPPEAPSDTLTQQSSSATSTPTAPPDVGFPDLSAFTERIETFNQVNVPRVQGFSFSTAGGLLCGSNAYPDVEFEYVGCRGPLPGQGPGDWAVRAHHSESATVEPLRDDPDLAADRQNPPPVLPPGDKVTAEKGDAVCAVTDDGTVACQVGAHGFVITSTSVRLF
ncbi:hypothetical protein ACAG25_18595 [Mycobacterium sp. pV006]|uniref:hypothetical protein n=1 Tax=Mycobacterium sp. pV006 TaxID=3238983 RepID=UPI00351AC88C